MFFDFKERKAITNPPSNPPGDPYEGYLTLDKAYVKQGFPLHLRVLTALKFVTALKDAFDEQSGKIDCLSNEAFLVNTESGDLALIAEKLMNTGADSPSPSDISRFVAYSVFRLLCIDSPYDGSLTLTEFPFLSKAAKEEIESGKYGFIFAEGENKFSEYKGRDTYHRWRNIPVEVREVLTRELSGAQAPFESQTKAVAEAAGQDPAEAQPLTLEEWLKAMRILRDYLVFADGQFKFWNPENAEIALFLRVDDYKIPVWPRKAIYAYHVEAGKEDTENGLVAGINAEGRLENRSAFKWSVKCSAGTLEAEQGDSIVPEPGMTITVNGKELKVESGDIDE